MSNLYISFDMQLLARDIPLFQTELFELFRHVRAATHVDALVRELFRDERNECLHATAVAFPVWGWIAEREVQEEIVVLLCEGRELLGPEQIFFTAYAEHEV